jgi:Cd2+/Zn2+-exporting ATPase
MTNKNYFKVDGLDCSEEVGILNKEFSGKAGILNLECDVITGKMTVTYDPQLITPENIIQRVSKTGMQAEVWTNKKDQKEIFETVWSSHGRLIMATISGTMLLIGFCIHWFTEGDFLEALIGTGKEHHFPLLSIVFYIGAIISGTFYVIPKALLAARKFLPDMNFLMIVATISAMILGDWFEAGSIAFLFATALLLEHWSIGRARRAISGLMDMSPTMARYICPHDGDIIEKPVDEVPVGVTVIVRPGEKIPLDGEVLKGRSKVNQAPITGESMPASKNIGDEVFAGTINGDGLLEIKTTKAANDTTLARIIQLVETAQTGRSQFEQWVHKFARYYTPTMIALAVCIMIIPPLFLGAIWTEWFYRGLVILVIACPCALVISTPVSIVSGLTSAARNGVLIKGGAYLEIAAHLRAVCLDKTGTLTYGHPEVQQVVAFNGHTPIELLKIAATLETHSEHPLARAILHKAETENIIPDTVENYQIIKGKGAEAVIDGKLFWIGSHRLMDEVGRETKEIHDKAESLEDAGHSVVAIGDENHICGLISVSDSVRKGASVTLQEIKKAGVDKVVMLTGDNIGSAKDAAKVTGVDEFQAELLPEDKVKAVESLVREFKHVAMIGDGVNDAPAMAASSVGIAMGAMGTDVAIETADIALMSDDLSKIPWLIKHSHRTLQIIKQNIAFTLSLKLAFIFLAMLNLATLWMAIVADMGASLVVIFNGLRLLKIKSDRKTIRSR